MGEFSPQWAHRAKLSAQPCRNVALISGSVRVPYRRPGQPTRGGQLGRIYEYFLSQFASAEGKKGGEFYAPRCIVKLRVEMLEPYRGRVYDPVLRLIGMFVQSVEFIRAQSNGNDNGGKAKADISIYGQESNYMTWRLVKMNLAIRGIEGQIAHGDTLGIVG